MRFLMVLNTGSSSVKFRLFGLVADLPLIAGGRVENIGTAPVFRAAMTNATEEGPLSLPGETSHADAVRMILRWLEGRGVSGRDLSAAAHRIVHGGDRYGTPVRLDSAALDYLRGLCVLAPLHQSHNLEGVDIFAAEMPDLPQYGCFDTAFHAGHDALRSVFALPEKVREKRVRRYGFHGLSYAWVAHCLEKDAPHLHRGRVVAAHLGNGASLCAMKGGKSIDTTMGMTALDGLPMGTRSGAIDAGVVFYMIRDLGFSLAEAERLLYEESGLKGLSGMTNDVKVLSGSGDEKAVFALDYFCLKTAQYIAAMAVSIGGMEALVFTGGIGENAPGIREKIQDYLSFLPPFETRIIAADEERGMAQDLWNLYQGVLAV